jgi:hypothetical protein
MSMNYYPLTGFALAKLDDQLKLSMATNRTLADKGDVSKLLAINTQTPSNAGVAIEMEALGQNWM